MRYVVTKKRIKMRYVITKIRRTIPDYPDYMATTDGRIYSVRRKIYLRPGHANGYLFVYLRKDKKAKPLYVHRIVGKTFIPNINNYPEINHKNEIKGDNRVENLEWCTHSYNNRYGTISQRKKQTWEAKRNGK